MLTDQEKVMIKNKELLVQNSISGQLVNVKEGLSFFHDMDNKNHYNYALNILTSNPSELGELKKMLEGDVSLKYTLNSIEIIDRNTTEKILFVVSNEKGHQIVHDLVNKDDYKKIIFGYELSYLKNHSFDLSKLSISKEQSKDEVLVNSFVSEEEEPETEIGGGMTCNSGGAGSTECSVGDIYSSCSVSCGAGYYACCEASGNNCKCIKNKK